MLITVIYHYVRPTFDESPYESVHGVTPSQLESQLSMLSKAGTFVSAEEIRAHIRGESELPDRSIAITFDDGLREQYEHAWPTLLPLDIPAIFYVNTAPILSSSVLPVHKVHLLRSEVAPQDFADLLSRHALGLGLGIDVNGGHPDATLHYRYDSPDVARLKYLLNFVLPAADRDRLVDACFQEIFAGKEAEISNNLYMEVSQLRELGAHRLVGTHTHEHLPLGLQPQATVREQIEVSLTLLEDWSGYRPFTLSYPYGSRDACSVEVSEIAAQLGIDFALTTEPAANKSLARPLHLARFDSNDMPGGKAARWTASELFDKVPHASWFHE